MKEWIERNPDKDSDLAFPATTEAVRINIFNLLRESLINTSDLKNHIVFLDKNHPTGPVFEQINQYIDQL